MGRFTEEKRGDEAEGKLTGAVNIAVFAVFHTVHRAWFVARWEYKYKGGAGMGNLTFGVMGGKSGTIWQRCGNGWHDGRQKRQGDVAAV
jgi:hypothetical protein